MDLREELTKIVGIENLFQDPEVLKHYSKDYSLAPRGMPNYVIKPKDAQEVQEVVRLANEHRIPLVPCSSKVHFHGATIPREGGIVLDLTKMNRILEFDEPNRRVRIEPGVTWEQLTNELGKRGFKLVIPLLPHSLRSVLTDYLEREVPVTTVYEYGEPLQGMEVVWPNGELFRTGSASAPGYPNSPARGVHPAGPGLDFWRLLQGAQGTMGIVTWANIKIQTLPQLNKVFFASFEETHAAVEFLYRVLRLRIGQECLLLNRINLAAILAEDWPSDFERLRALLPPWTLIFVLSGLHRRPEEKVAYEEKALLELKKNEFPRISLATTLPGTPGSRRKVLEMLRKPWPKDMPYWKHRYKGGCQSLFFITRPVLAQKFIKLVEEAVAKETYPVSDIGGYLQPIEHNRACQLELSFFHNPENPTETGLVRRLYSKAARSLLGEGALFTRPYGELASLVYQRAAEYTMALKRTKKIFDPNNIMNPSQLCF